MTPKDIVNSYWRAWNDHNLADLLPLLAADFVSMSPFNPGNPTSKDMFAKGFEMFEKSLPDLKEEVVNIMTEGNKVACEVIESATVTGSIQLPTGVIAPTNRSYKLNVASFFRINDQGLIAEQRNYWDTASWAHQVGIDPNSFDSNSESSKPAGKSDKG